MAVEKRAETKIEKLKTGLNALIKENENLKNDLNKSQSLLNEIKIIYDFWILNILMALFESLY